MFQQLCSFIIDNLQKKLSSSGWMASPSLKWPLSLYCSCGTKKCFIAAVKNTSEEWWIFQLVLHTAAEQNLTCEASLIEVKIVFLGLFYHSKWTDSRTEFLWRQKKVKYVLSALVKNTKQTKNCQRSKEHFSQLLRKINLIQYSLKRT